MHKVIKIKLHFLFMVLGLLFYSPLLLSSDLTDELVEAKRGFRAFLITDYKKLIEAQVLAYNILVEETGVVSKSGGFDGSDNKETKQLFIDSENGKRLVDEFDEVAQWFGVYQADKIVGCSRVFGKRKEDNKMLAELFHKDLPEKYTGEKVLEVGRLCGAKEFRGGGLILSLLHKKMLDFAKEGNYSLLTYTAQDNVMRTLTSVLYEHEDISAAKYKFFFLPREKLDLSLEITNEKLAKIVMLDRRSSSSSSMQSPVGVSDAKVFE